MYKTLSDVLAYLLHTTATWCFAREMHIHIMWGNMSKGHFRHQASCHAWWHFMIWTLQSSLMKFFSWVHVESAGHFKAKSIIVRFCFDHGNEKHEPQLGHHPEAGQWLTGVEKLHCCPIHQLVMGSNEWKLIYFHCFYLLDKTCFEKAGSLDDAV